MAGRALWWLLVGALLVSTALVVARRITWYLSVDQFGYLTFARDLRAGRVFHDWPPARALGDLLPPRTDVLAQTYVADHGRLWCRYSPGFPLLLAAWTAALGDTCAHALNPTLFVGLLALAIAFQRRLLRSRWRALLGGFLLVLLPTMLHLWGLTLTRDVSAHIAAFGALFLLLPSGARRLGARRVATAALLLGGAVSIRPDEVLYLLPAGVLATSRWRTERTRPGAAARALAAGAVAFVVGCAPLFAYDWLVTGNPLVLTQAMELDGFAGDAPAAVPPAETDGGRLGYPSPVWHGGTILQVNGGGLSLRHLPRTFVGHLEFLRDAYGPAFLVAAVVGAVVALALRPLVFFVVVPYVLAALLFYGCWAQPDTRYLIGVHLFGVVLITEGLFGPLELVRRLARRSRLARGVATVSALGALVAAAAARDYVPPGESALGLLSWLLPAFVGVGALAAALAPKRRVAGVVVPVAALVVSALGLWRATAALGRRAAFQQPEMLAARDTLRAAVEPGAVVITTEDVGRPAENIEAYSGVAHALYLTDLERWRVSHAAAAARLLAAGMPVYVLMPADVRSSTTLLTGLQRVLDVALVRDIPREDAMRFFVSGPASEGIRMYLHRVTARPPVAR